MGVYTVEVQMATHAEVMAGAARPEWSTCMFTRETYETGNINWTEKTWVRVAADNDDEAVEVAVAMAMATNPREVMPTGVEFVDFPT